MNIFILDLNPVKAAQYHCDKHVVKMILESAQMLSTSLGGPLKPTHVHHPCSKWVKESLANYTWLYNLFRSLLFQYELRYKKLHAYEKLLIPLRQTSSTRLPINFVQCVPEELKQQDPVQAYRQYYKIHKARFARWNKGVEAPEWWNV